MPEALAVFIAPPSPDALRARLVGRGTDDADQIERRMQTAERELEAQPEFAHVVVNDRLEQATDELERIVRDALASKASRAANLESPDEGLTT
jgi:guanylate kinase